MIFAREINDPLTSLVKQLDATVAKQGKRKMATFVVFCTDADDIQAKIKQLAEKEKLENVSFGVTKPDGPYKGAAAIHPDADVTVVLYAARNVKANHTFKKGDFSTRSVDVIVRDLPKILGNSD